MGDKVTCKAALKKSVDPTRPDYLYLEANGIRVLPCRPKGESRRNNGAPEWEYVEAGDCLVITPSMLCTVSGFHTDFQWTVEAEVCPEAIGGYEHFMSLNPSLDQP